MSKLEHDDWRYHAFISYSHAADETLAPALQNGLTRFARPWNRLRAARVFRDNATLSANPALWASIEQALTQSRYFILLASPEAAGSPWVTKEVDWWARRKSSTHLLIALTEGEIVWDAEKQDFDWTRTTALPRRLQGAFADEPRYIDLRWARTADHVSMTDPRFRECIADLAAPLHGRDKDELIGEDVRQYRRFVRYRNLGIMSLVMLAIGLGIAAIAAYLNSQEAIRERNAAEARLLISQSQQKLEKSYDMALLLSIEAERLDTSLITHAYLHQVIESRRDILGILHGHNAKIEGLAVGSSGRRLVSVDADGIVLVHDPTTRAAVQSFRIDAKIDAMAMHPDEKMLALATGSEIQFWDLAAGRRVGEALTGHKGTIAGLTFDPSGTVLASTSWDNTALLWDVASRRMLHAPLKGHKDRTDPMSMAVGVRAGAFSPDSRLLATTGGDNTVVIWDVTTGTQSGQALVGHFTRADQPFPGVEAAAFSPDSQVLATGGLDHEIRLWNVTSRQQIGEPLRAHASGVTALVFDLSGAVLFSADQFGSILRWDLKSRTPTGDPRRGHDGSVTGLAFVANLAQLVSSGEDGRIVIWNPSANPLALRPRLAQYLPHTSLDARPVFNRAMGRRLFPELLRKVVFSKSGKLLASVSDDAVLVIWDMGAHKEVERFSALPTGVFAAAFDPIDSEIAVGGLDDSVIVHQIGGGGDARLSGHGRAVGALAFSSDRKLLAAGTAAGSVVLWSRDPWERIGEVHEHKSPVLLVTFRNNDREVVAIDQAGALKIWDRSANNVVRAEDMEAGKEQIHSVSATEKLLAIRVESGVKLWDLTTWKPFGAGLIALNADKVSGDGLALSANGRRIAIGQGTRATIYDTSSGTEQLPWLNVRTSLGDIALSPDGKTLAAVGEYYVYLWDLDPATWARQACDIAGRVLTKEEWQQYLPAHQYKPACTGGLSSVSVR